jgi:hypothetical protein
MEGRIMENERFVPATIKTDISEGQGIRGTYYGKSIPETSIPYPVIFAPCPVLTI